MASLLLLKSLLYIKALQRKKIRSVKSYKKKNICRICKENEGFISIFNNILQPDIAQEIQNFSGVIIQETDTTSKYMCQSCLDLLNGCIKFRDMCRQNNEFLSNIKLDSYEIPECKDLIESSSEDDSDAEFDMHVASNSNIFYVSFMVSEDQDNVQEQIENDYESNGSVDNNDSDNLQLPTFSDDFDYNESIWACRTCREAFYDLGSYNRHLPLCNTLSMKNQTKTKKQKRKFLCDVCGKTLASFASLNIHRNTHKNIFPYKCDVCAYRGRSIDLLRVHKRVHLDVKPYKCSLCPKTTTTASNLQRHVKYVHNTDRPHKCLYCERAFFYERDVTKHVKEIHLRQDAAECPICHKKFATHKIMRGHRLKVHKIKAERSGRLPSYLKYQNTLQNDDMANEVTYQNL